MQQFSYEKIDPPKFKLGGHSSAQVRCDAEISLLGTFMTLSDCLDGSELSEVGTIDDG